MPRQLASNFVICREDEVKAVLMKEEGGGEVGVGEWKHSRQTHLLLKQGCCYFHFAETFLGLW